MDLDAFSAVHSASWQRLDDLSRRRRLSGAESDELVALYQQVATHLSAVRSAAPDPSVVSHLSDLLARARAAIAGAHDPSWSDLARFFAVVLPAAFYRVRWWTVGVTVAFCLVATVAGFTMYHDPSAQAAFGTPAELRLYAEQQFASYYTQYDGSSFAAQVWTNNAWIAARAIALGPTGIGPIYLMVANAMAVGQAGALLAEFDMLEVFFGLILPHGLLELTSIFIACGAGLKLFWTWVSPGPRTRSRALAQEGRALITLVIGLAVVLLLCGLIEGYVTPSSLPSGIKIFIGALALADTYLALKAAGRL